MKKYILSVLPLLALSMGFVGCDDDNAIQKESVITVDSYVQNNFDKWLDLHYVLPYNIDFKYRYEEIEADIRRHIRHCAMHHNVCQDQVLQVMKHIIEPQK